MVLYSKPFFWITKNGVFLNHPCFPGIQGSDKVQHCHFQSRTRPKLFCLLRVYLLENLTYLCSCSFFCWIIHWGLQIPAEGNFQKKEKWWLSYRRENKHVNNFILLINRRGSQCHNQFKRKFKDYYLYFSIRNIDMNM